MGRLASGSPKEVRRRLGWAWIGLERLLSYSVIERDWPCNFQMSGCTGGSDDASPLYISNALIQELFNKIVLSPQPPQQRPALRTSSRRQGVGSGEKNNWCATPDFRLDANQKKL